MWRSKLDQLVGLLEKVPQPQSFEAKTGVYEPYYNIELRSSNWEITPYANYTRLDGSPGREVRLSLGVMDSSKANITQSELDSLFFLEADFKDMSIKIQHGFHVDDGHGHSFNKWFVCFHCRVLVVVKDRF